MKNQTVDEERIAFANGQQQKSRRYKTHVLYFCGVFLPCVVLLTLLTLYSVYTSPYRTLQTYCQAYLEQNWNGIYGCLSLSIEDMLHNGKEGRTAFVGAMQQEPLPVPQITSYHIENDIAGKGPITHTPTRTYTVAFTQAGSSKRHTEIITLAKQENGSWLVATGPFSDALKCMLNPNQVTQYT